MLGFFDPSISYNKQGLIPGAATGRITDEKGEPIANASIIIKGTSTGVTTDANGFFKLQNFQTNSSIIVSSIGYISKEVAIKPGYFTISLSPANNELSEVVVTGYSLQSNVAGVEANNNRYKAKKESI